MTSNKKTSNKKTVPINKDHIVATRKTNPPSIQDATVESARALVEELSTITWSNGQLTVSVMQEYALKTLRAAAFILEHLPGYQARSTTVARDETCLEPTLMNEIAWTPQRHLGTWHPRGRRNRRLAEEVQRCDRSWSHNPHDS